MALGQPYSVYFYCPLSVSFHQYATLISIYTIVLPDVQRGAACGSSRNNALPISVLDRKLFPLFFSIQCYSMNQAVRCQPGCSEAKVCTRFKKMQDLLRTIWQRDGLVSQYYCFPPKYQSAIVPHSFLS